MNDLCDNCKASGLPILPVRYTVVPADMAPTLPDWAGGNRIKSVDIGPDYRYALRTLREGYVYIFYDKNQYGSKQWECWTVTGNGCLVKQPSAELAQPPTPEVLCQRQGHNDINVQMIVIERPEKCGTAWIAFSEHKWSAETLERYKTDKKLRDARMQTIKVWPLATTGKHSHGVSATVEALESVIEYKVPNPGGLLPDETMAVQPLSKQDGSFSDFLLKRQSTRYPWNPRAGQAKAVAERMQQRANRKDGGSNIPVVFALWDAIGIAHELNGFRNDVAGRLEQYKNERELELTTLNLIDGLKIALADRAEDRERQYMDEIKRNTSSAHSIPAIQARRAGAATLPEPERSKELEVCTIREDWARRDVPLSPTFGMRLEEVNQKAEPKRSQEIQALKRDVEEFLANRDKNYAENVKNARANTWPRYEKKFRPGAIKGFRDKYEKLIETLDSRIEVRTQALVNWLEAPLLIDTFEDFHPESIEDGVEFDDKVATALFGITSTKVGEKRIKDWVAELNANKSSNLLWRAFALNQEKVRADLTELLAVASATTAPIGTLSVDFLTSHIRKWADMYKKANTMQNTVLRAANPSEGIKSIRVTGVDRLFLTVGDKLFLPFIQRRVDTGAEFAVRGLMLARASVEPDRILDAIKAQAKEEGLARSAVVRRLQAAGAFIGKGEDFKDARYQDLRKTWDNLKADKTRGPQAFKENRLALVVAVLELINLAKIAFEFKDNQRTLGELAAASCSTTAAMMDIVANAAKHLIGDKVSVTFQVFKFGGGVLSAGAGYYVAIQEWDKANRSRSQDRYFLAVSYYAKSFAQFGGSTLGLLASISYAAPLMQASGSQAVKSIGARLLLYRLFCLTWAVRLNLVGIVITVLVWIFVDDDLQDWCQETPFGDRSSKGPRDSKLLMDNLGKALKEIS